jgi:hypothetical protein
MSNRADRALESAVRERHKPSSSPGGDAQIRPPIRVHPRRGYVTFLAALLRCIANPRLKLPRSAP